MPKYDSRFVMVDAGNLYCESAGSGEAVIFVHGFTLDHDMWDRQVDYFQPRFRAVTYDLRGFGRSSVPKNSHAADRLSGIKAPTQAIVGAREL